MVAKRSFLFYLPETSPFLKISAISKLVFVVGVSLSALSILDFYANLSIFLFTVSLMFVARVPLKNLRLWLYGFAFMLFFLTTMYTLLSRIPGQTVYFVFPWGTYITENTLPRAMSVAFRIWSMIFAALIFLSTTTDTDIMMSLAKMKVPYTFSFLITLSLRSIQLFAEDWKSIIDAHYSRGVDLNKGSIINRLKNYISLSAPLLITTMNKIREIDFAAESRGFKLGLKNRTYIDDFKWTIGDAVLMTISVLIVVFTYAYIFAG